MNEYEIRDDFIGIFNNVLGNELCDNYINFFEKSLEENLTYEQSKSRHKLDNISTDVITSKFIIDRNLSYTATAFLELFWAKCYPLYAEKFSILQECSQHNIYDVKIQKTLPGGGYHVWHAENTNLVQRNRMLSFVLYLNDVEDGGETEFLYQKVRFKPTKDRLVLFPAGFTHTHRENPPLTGDKYIITGWIEYSV
jgi:hypothetical protein